MGVTTEEFFAVLEKSNLLSPAQLVEARRLAQPSDDPAAVARTLAQQNLLSRWQAGQLLAGRSAFFLGKYKLIELLGRGGMGSVFLGEHTTMNRRVALKIISKQVGQDPASLQRFLSEARAIAALDHPNIVRAYSVDSEDDRYYIVMEYIDGKDLQRLVEEEGPLGYARAADYIRQAAEGLAHAHARNLIHCDIKPSNLLVSTQGVVKILDLGLARWSDRAEGPSNGAEQKVLGSVDYLAPEQAVESPEFDQRADIYSLGCTLYFLLTGQSPFPEGTLAQRILKHQTEQPRSIIDRRPDAPSYLVKVCQKMMAKRPGERFQSADEVSQALSTWGPNDRSALRIAPLKKAEALDLPDAARTASPARDKAFQPARANGPSAKGGSRSDKKRGVLHTRQQKTMAAVIAGLAVLALISVGAALMIRSAFVNRRQQTVAAADAQGKDRNLTGRKKAPAARSLVEKPPAEKPAGKQPPEKPPTEKPPAEKPPAEKPSTEKPPTEKPPAEEPPTEKPPAEKPPKKPKPEKPPEEPKPEKPKQQDPLHDLAAVVDLPPLDAESGAGGEPGEPLALGQVHVQTPSALEIALVGGDEAVKGSRLFVLERDASSPGQSAWLIHLAAAAKPGAPVDKTDVARLWLDQETLSFQWLAGAAQAHAAALRHCGLAISAEGSSRWLPLGRAQTAEPLVVDFDRGLGRVTLPAEGLPELSSLRLQITSLDGPFPKYELKPSDTIPVRGQTSIVMVDKKLPGFALNVTFNVQGRTPRLEAAAVFQLAGQSPRPLKRRDAGTVMMATLTAQQRLQIAVKTLKDKPKELAEKQLKAVDTAVEQLRALQDACGALHRTGKIHYRIFEAVGEHQIELFRSQPGPKK